MVHCHIVKVLISTEHNLKVYESFRKQQSTVIHPNLSKVSEQQIGFVISLISIFGFWCF